MLVNSGTSASGFTAFDMVSIPNISTANPSRMRPISCFLSSLVNSRKTIPINANTGQNGIDQALVFKEAVSITGIIITKMDGTSKGGIILSIRDRLQLPVKFIGLGEKMDELEEFDLDKYLYGLLLGNEDRENG